MLRKYSNFDEQQFYSLYAEDIEAYLKRREKQFKHQEDVTERNDSEGEERDMIEAIKYNLDNGLMTVDEVRSAKTPKEKIDLAMRALMNRGLHLLEEWASIYSKEKLRNKVKATIEEKREAQRQAESISVKTCDVNNIRETLPFLLPQQ